MKVVFLLDNNEYVESAPEKLQIRQLSEGVAALGIEVTVPVLKEDKTAELNEDGTPKTQVGFRPFINYNVTLQIPQPAAATAVSPVVPALPAPTAVSAPAGTQKAKGKASAKRKAN
jgi:hypothetical protein